MHFPLSSVTIRPEHCDPLFLLRELGNGRAYCALLESASRQGDNEYSFLALGARDVITVRDGRVSGSRFVPDGETPDPLHPFSTLIGSGEGETARLSMGYIGFLSYEAARYFEDVRLVPDPDIPDALFVLPEVLVRMNHGTRDVDIIAHRGTAEDIHRIAAIIRSSPFYDETERKPAEPVTSAIPEEFAACRRTTCEAFCAAVASVRESILAGEAFQVVLSQELLLPLDVSPDRVYEQLRKISPSPYLYYFRTPGRTIVGASPETLIRVENRRILYRPIAGTRKRTGDAAKDAAMRAELLSDEKERCEHQMLVDLGRNDVGKVAEIGSVTVRNPFRVETFAHVFHIVSDVVARLRADRTPLDALRAVFPAGTLTGAPKVRAMRMIRDLEGAPRGIYGGAIGYIDLSGNIDFAIMIRTMLFAGDCIRLRVGAGIVAGSIPQREDRECLHKARSCLLAVDRARHSLPRP